MEYDYIECGDCLELMKGIPDKSVDMILCDLPYGTTACKWDTVIPFEPLWEQYNRVIKDNGAVVLFGSEPFSSALRSSNFQLYKYDWKWIKDGSTGFQTVKTQPMRKYEDIMIFSKGTIASGSPRNMKYNPQGLVEINKTKKVGKKPQYIGDRPNQEGKEYVAKYTNYPVNLLEFPRDKNTVHPTQKPIALLEYLIKTYTNEGDVVLDNCMGSGSTCVACVNTNRHYIGFEKEPKYFDIACKRLDEVEGVENGLI